MLHNIKKGTSKSPGNVRNILIATKQDEEVQVDVQIWIWF